MCYIYVYIEYHEKQSSEDTQFKYDLIDLCTSHTHIERHIYVCMCMYVCIYVSLSLCM